MNDFRLSVTQLEGSRARTQIQVSDSRSSALSTPVPLQSVQNQLTAHLASFVCTLWGASDWLHLYLKGQGSEHPPGMQPSRPERNIMYQPPSKTNMINWKLNLSKGSERKSTLPHLSSCPHPYRDSALRPKLFP